MKVVMSIAQYTAMLVLFFEAYQAETQEIINSRTAFIL